MAVRVNFFDFMYSNDYDYRYSIESFLSYNERNAFLKGDFSLEATINGVTVASIDLKKLPLYQETIQVGNGQGFAGVGNRFMDTLVESPPTYSYSYEFQAIPIEESGSLDVQVILMSRQSADNYRKVAYSTVETVQVSEDELFAEEIPNLPPEGALLSPRNSDLARAEAVLTDTDVQTSSEFGQIERIAMTSIGRNYDPDNLPEVIIQGGGGTGAEATVEIVDGGIADLMVLSWGENYVDSELNDGGLWITPIDENNGSGFMAQIKVSNGVLDDVQNIENGAILNGGAGYEDIVGKKGYVRVFDYNKGNGAAGYISATNDVGGITEIAITDGGKHYDPMTSIIFILDEFNGVSHNGYGFESGTLNILNGVINSFEILESGSGYVLKPYLIPVQANEYGIWQEDLSRNIAEVTTKTSDQLEEHLFDNFDRLGTYLANGYPDAGVYEFNATTYELLTDTSNSGFYAVSSWLDFEVNSTTGSGFHARVVETMLRDGSIKVVLENPGRGYLLPPQVILRGGEFLTTGKEDRRQPLQVTAGTKVLLLADTFDFDGDVKRVRFYANGVDLSIQTKACS